MDFIPEFDEINSQSQSHPQEAFRCQVTGI
jgi:hypothetical protein